MATSQERFGIDHLTVVPSNFRPEPEPEDDEDESVDATTSA
jgi:hypothetical protein